MNRSGMVIIGAGETGARAAMTLRGAGYDGPITLIGDEDHPPYERPPLSKAVLQSAEEPAVPRIGDTVRFDELGIAHLSGSAAVALDRNKHEVRLASGRLIPYERLLVATGAVPRRLNLPGRQHLRYLRNYRDSLALRARLLPGNHLVLIGAGFIGLEVAASAVARGAHVTVLEVLPRILSRGVPGAIADLVAARHQAAGVDILTGVAIARIDATVSGLSVALADGARIDADLIIAGVGVMPDSAIAENAGLAIDNGIAVNARLTTSDPDIFAAGDCCSFPHALYGDRRIRLEAWRNAQDQGAFAARAMLGASEPYGAVPWFWSDQHDLTLQVAGLVDEGRTTVVRDLGDDARIHFHIADDGRLVAASGIGPTGKVARDIRLAEMLIARRARPEPGSLASPAVKLKALLAA
jgi:3-phenylpropionate/trans-cinnamate dioxygenase ferredoxin reductase subunit